VHLVSLGLRGVCHRPDLVHFYRWRRQPRQLALYRHVSADSGHEA
jgi:hypothetical protein